MNRVRTQWGLRPADSCGNFYASPTEIYERIRQGNHSLASRFSALLIPLSYSLGYTFSMIVLKSSEKDRENTQHYDTLWLVKTYYSTVDFFCEEFFCYNE